LALLPNAVVVAVAVVEGRLGLGETEAATDVAMWRLFLAWMRWQSVGRFSFMLGEWAEIKVNLVDEMKRLVCYRLGLIKVSELLLNKLVDEKNVSFI